MLVKQLFGFLAKHFDIKLTCRLSAVVVRVPCFVKSVITTTNSWSCLTWELCGNGFKVDDFCELNDFYLGAPLKKQFCTLKSDNNIMASF